jgi:hypothetical protein
MSTSTTADALDQREDPDRVFYATGILIDKDALQAEQDYHRGRLARALVVGGGSGTLLGLKVSYVQTPIEEIAVSAGLAVDRVGRLVELPGDACIRLDRWYASLTAADVRLYPSNTVSTVLGATVTFGAVIADVYLRFAACERGKTPAFATGPFDSIDAVAPSRLRDGWELKLVPRAEEGVPPVPRNPWADLAGIAAPADRSRKLHDLIVSGAPVDPGSDNAALPAPWQPTFRNGVFLARVVLPAGAPATVGATPARTADPVQVIDRDRTFVYSTGALAALLGV